MKNMKLVELLPVGKIEPRKSVTEIIDITDSGDGVSVAIDDYDDVTFIPVGEVGKDKLGDIFDILRTSFWFQRMVIRFARLKKTKVKVIFRPNGIEFK
jgi:hypothetical protein